jgi:hypothetical protein
LSGSLYFFYSSIILSTSTISSLINDIDSTKEVGNEIQNTFIISYDISISWIKSSGFNIFSSPIITFLMTPPDLFLHGDAVFELNSNFKEKSRHCKISDYSIEPEKSKIKKFPVVMSIRPSFDRNLKG